MKIQIGGEWKVYWDNIPLPLGAEVIGTVSLTEGNNGVLLFLQSGIYVQGNDGSVTSLEQMEVKKELGLPTHGGNRAGAGRPKTGRTQRKLQATNEEWELILEYADEVRSK